MSDPQTQIHGAPWICPDGASDEEIAALARMNDIMAGLSPDERLRVSNFLYHRYGMPAATTFKLVTAPTNNGGLEESKR